MSAFQSVILRYLRCIADVSFALSRPTVLVPFAIVSLLQLILLCAYVFFASPPFVWLSPRVIAAFGGGHLLHYPSHLLALPDAVVWIRVAAWVVAGFWALRSAADAVWTRLDDPLRTRRDAAPRRPVSLASLFLAGVAFWGVFVALRWFLAWLGGAPIAGRFGLVWGAADAVLAPFLTLTFVDAWVAMGETRGVLRGMVAGARTLWADVAPALLVATSVAILSAPFHLLTGNVESFVRDGHPGVAVFGSAAALIWDAPMRVLLVVSAASLVIGRREGTP